MPTDIVSQLTGASIRICGLALVAFVSLSVLRIRSAAARHAMWTVVLIGMLLQIPLQMIAPPMLLKAPPIAPARTQLRVMQSAPPSMSTARATVPASHAREPVMLSRMSWRSPVTSIYLAISLLLFLRLAFGCWGLHKIVRSSTPIPSLGVNVFESTRVVVPGSVGSLRARILLPRVWRDWDAPNLAAILAHERAHIQRHDWFTQFASHINTCIFWFHPLAWWMDRQLARLAEEACDDVALSETKDKEEYAATLVDIARTAAANGGVLSWPVISMATDSNVRRRVNRILKRTFQVPKPFGRLAWAALFVCSVPVIYLSAAISLGPARRDSTALTHVLIPKRGAQEQVLPLLQEREEPPGLHANVLSKQNSKSSMSPVRSQPEEQPLAICMLVDTSGSMDERRAEVKAVALALVKASKSTEEICIFTFDDEVFNSLPNGEDFTSDIKEMEDALLQVDARGGTAMRDAVEMGIEHLALTAQNRRTALVLITDGYDTSSKVSQKELLQKVKSSGALIYCIGLLSENNPKQQGAAKLALDQLADESGGLAFYPKNVAQVKNISHQISDKIGER